MTSCGPRRTGFTELLPLLTDLPSKGFSDVGHPDAKKKLSKSVGGAGGEGVEEDFCVSKSGV